jgi:AcrR family transcriptional regulator
LTVSTWRVDTVSVAAAPSTRDRLVETARAYLDTEGLDGIGLREIARRAGLSHGAPSRHFPTLAALLAAVAAQGFRDLYAAVDAAVRDADPATPAVRVAAASRGYLRFALAHPGVFGLIFRRDLVDTDDPEYLTAGGIAFGQLVGLVAAAQGRGLPDDLPAAELAGLLWASVHGLASLHLHGVLVPTTGQSDPTVLLEHLSSLLIS